METTNLELQLVADYIKNTDTSVFLTGKAGTGKTTFLRSLKENTSKRMIITAPTGVAAINAGGVTLHSFFQMPFGPMVPGSEAYGTDRQRRFRKEKKNIIVSLDLLVIDEISMVRADLLDGVDTVLRRYRRNDQPFGGVQLLMIGDLHQLPPVVKDDEWRLLRDHYQSPYFFSCQALAKTPLATIALKHIYRQSDNHFIQLLNRVRDNNLDGQSLAELNQRYQPKFSPSDKNQGYITLCTHNRQADTINQARLKEVAGKSRSFQALIEGDFPEYAYPTQASLELKNGAQVMFVRNDSSPEKLYYNGKIGKITRIINETIWVQCEGDREEIKVEPVTWENIKYQLDQESNEITEDKVGFFIQHPLKLAWAITIHKSQGLTFSRVVIDAGAAFAHGQVYVALSRCKTLEGIVLSSPISLQAVKTDRTVMQFTELAIQNQPTPEQLIVAKTSYQQRLLSQCFDFKPLSLRLYGLLNILAQNGQVIRVSGGGDQDELRDRAVKEIFVVGENFKRQLSKLFVAGGLPEEDEVLKERTIKASAYFQEKLETILGPLVTEIIIESDNQELRKRCQEAIKQLQKEFMVKLAVVKSCRNGFDLHLYLRAISAAEVQSVSVARSKKQSSQYLESDIDHPELFQELKDWRSKQAAVEEVPHYRILHQKILIQIAVTLPNDLTSLKMIKGLGKRTAEKYGAPLLAMVVAYRQKHKIKDVTLPSPKTMSGTQNHGEANSKTKPPGETKQISFDLLQKGLTMAEIAKERGLNISTIEVHLTAFVANGELAIDKLLSNEKQQLIEQKIAERDGQTYGQIKKGLGDDYSYGEIKLVLAHLQAKESQV